MSAFISRLVRLVLATVSPADSKQATALVAKYRADGGGSNRTNWSQVTAVLSAVLACVRTGKAVELTAFYTDQAGGKSPAYNLAHRQLSAGVIRPMWHRVQVVALVGCQADGKGAVSGTPNTTAKMGPGVRLFVVPVA